MRADGHHHRREIDEDDAAGDGGEVERHIDQGELEGKKQPGNDPGQQRTIADRQRHAAGPAPQDDEERTEQRAQPRLEHRLHADIGHLDRDLIEAPAEAEENYRRRREGIDPVMNDRHLRRDADSHPASSGSASPASSASKPSRFQLCCMCGGSGAVTSRLPPAGCGMTIRRACR